MNLLCRLSIAMLFTAAPMSASAGDINNSSNHSAAFARTLTRNASTEADAAVYNPAGTAFAKDGFQISVHNQHYLKYDTLVRTQDGSEFTADDPVFFYPGLNLVYKVPEFPLALSMHLGVPTGGGSKSFNDGHPIFFDFEESIKNFVNEGAQEQGISTDVAAGASLRTGSGEFIKGSSTFLGATFNLAYAPTEWLSLSVGFRATAGNGTYDAFALYEIENTEDGNSIENLGNLVPDEISVNVKTKEEGKGLNGILGLHLRPTDHLEISAQWQSNTKMKLKRSFLLQDQLNEDGYLPSSTESGDDLYRIDADVSSEVFPTAENRKDIPGILSLGLKYGATPDIDVELALNYYQNEQAKWGRDEDGVKTGRFYNNSYEAALSAEWKQDWGRLSAGYLYSTSSIDPEGQDYLTYSIPSHSLAAGGRYNLSESASVDVGILHVMYTSDKNAAETLEYRKGATGLVVGLDYAW